MCGLKEFLRVQGTFLKKFLQTHFSIWKKLNLIRYIKTLIKEFPPRPLRLRLATFSMGEGKPLSHCVTASLSWEPSQIESRP